MTFRIPRGHHRALPLRLGFWFSRKSFTWTVKFTESCRYSMYGENQFDTNKLIGIGYLPGHHKDSARFGWRYDTEREQINLLAYCYVNGHRIIQHICFCEIGKEYTITIQALANSYYFGVYEPGSVKASGIITVRHYHNKKFKYRLGTYFGGQARAPHEITIEISKV